MKSMVTRKRSYYLVVAAVGLWLAGAAPSHASTVTAGDTGDPAGRGIAYNWTVNMSGNDTTAGSTPAIAGTLGSLSWNDPINAGDPIGTGWTHTSRWTALTLTEAADLTITLAANGPATSGNAIGTSLVPAFSLFSGQQQTDGGLNGGYHVYNNSGTFDWSTIDVGYGPTTMSYVGNASASGTDSTISKTFSLGPGQYSIVFGGNPPSGAAAGPVPYQATLTTVPVPAAVWLFGSGLAGLAGLARRRAAR
ncbi:MAG: hypothetical protein CV089_00825 [Nitrospira sp. WS110]|nr:hypothetical protein [Nitrospira sp. WS110]